MVGDGDGKVGILSASLQVDDAEEAAEEELSLPLIEHRPDELGLVADPEGLIVHDAVVA